MLQWRAQNKTKENGKNGERDRERIEQEKCEMSYLNFGNAANKQNS